MNILQELMDLDVSDSMKRDIELVSKALDVIDTNSRDEAVQKLDMIHTKVLEIEDCFWRPMDSKEVYQKLISVAQELRQEEKAEHYQDQISNFQANELEFAGRLQDFFGNKLKALEYYSKALEFVPDHELALPGHEKALRNMDRAKKNAATLERKLQKDQEDPKLWLRYGIALMSLGEVKRAIDCYDKAIELDPDSPDPLARRGTAMESLGDYQGAMEYLERALEIKPNSMIAKRGRNYAEYFLGH